MTVTVRPYKGDKTKTLWEWEINGLYPDGSEYEKAPDGKGLRRKSHLTSETATRRWAESTEREMQRIWEETRAEGFRAAPFGAAWADYLTYCRTVKRNMSSTIKWKEKVHKYYLAPYIADDLRVDKIDDDRIEQMMKAMGALAPKTVNTAMGELHSFLAYCMRKKKLHRLPTIEPLPLERKIPKRLVLDDYKRLIGGCDELVRELGLWQPLVMSRLGGDCGLRMQESIALFLPDCDLIGARLYIQRAWSDGAIVTTKGKRFRVIPIEPDVVKLLADHQHGGTMLLHHDGHTSRWEGYNERVDRFILEVTPAVAYRWFFMAVQRAGISPKGRLHVLRHTFGSHLGDAGVDAHRIKDLLGHANLATSEIYVDLSGNATRAATKQLEEYRRSGRLAS